MSICPMFIKFPAAIVLFLLDMKRAVIYLGQDYLRRAKCLANDTLAFLLLERLCLTTSGCDRHGA